MSGATDWKEANQRHLLAALAVVRGALDRHAEGAEGFGAAPDPELDKALAAAAAAMSAPPALDIVAERFGLSAFERDVLLLCAGVELDSGFAARCAAAQGDAGRRAPTFSLALAALPGAHWSALTPAAPLRHWRLLEVGSGEGLTASPLRIDERVLHFLAGVETADDRLSGLVKPLTDTVELVPSQQELAQRIAAAWSEAAGRGILPAVQLCGGGDGAGARGIALAVGAHLGLHLHEIPVAAVPVAPAELDGLIRLWERESALSGSALLADATELDAADAAREGALARLTEELRGPLLIVLRERRPARQRPVLAFDLRVPSSAEQRALWRSALGPAAAAMNGQLDGVVSQFNLGAAAIRSAAAQAGREKTRAPPSGTPAARRAGRAWRVWRSASSRPRGGATSSSPRRRSARSARSPSTSAAAAPSTRSGGSPRAAAGGWGSAPCSRGRAARGRRWRPRCSPPNCGSTSTGSTSRRWSASTSARPRRTSAASSTPPRRGAILLFDEADALFGKRSEVKDSHDRYANIEVSYLLQRMEAYRGLAILTSNFKDALDTAFLRRLRFIVHFPFPDAAQRAEIWRRAFPAQTPTLGIDPEKLGRLSVTGGNIRNIALAAAFLAADEGSPVGMPHLLRAARGELAKIERPLSDAEVRGWVP